MLAFDTRARRWDKRSAKILALPADIVGPSTAADWNGPSPSVLNIHARETLAKALDPLGRRLAGAGVTPNAITVVGTVGSVTAALVFFPMGWWFVGSVIIWAFVMFDMVDGAVARAGGSVSPFGGVLDSTCDRIADAAIFGAAGWYFARHDERWLLLAALLCLVLGSVTSYIRARAEAAGFNATVGIAERAERLIVALVGTGLNGLGVPYILAIALWLLVAASTITVAQRFVTVYQQSRSLRAEQQVVR
ncbi:MAG TPA: CDP-alcohol phosphatidyltransferase family protein [Jatrophihabitantaceae bacterium]|nr:CDP-alcohol phosphatidyltransferase family protein [Jatrophihabitantaceae bacterium]